MLIIIVASSVTIWESIPLGSGALITPPDEILEIRGQEEQTGTLPWGVLFLRFPSTMKEDEEYQVGADLQLSNLGVPLRDRTKGRSIRMAHLMSARLSAPATQFAIPDADTGIQTIGTSGDFHFRWSLRPLYSQESHNVTLRVFAHADSSRDDILTPVLERTIVVAVIPNWKHRILGFIMEQLTTLPSAIRDLALMIGAIGAWGLWFVRRRYSGKH
jgi:hypothetical protein